jgi:hypothetical protein
VVDPAKPLALFEADDGGADFSNDRRYRFRLWRYWNRHEKAACFCMLNPSTANETDLDPTLRRCVGFARAWGCGGLEVVNLFAIVSPDPRVLLTDRDPIGEGNDDHIASAAMLAEVVVVGWGAFPEARVRSREVVDLLATVGVRPMCLGTTRAGHPRHPLYLRKTADLVPYGGQS